MERINESVLNEIGEILIGLKYQASLTQAMRITMPIVTVDKLYSLWEQLNERLSAN
jgi:hypothetical protein